MTRQFRFQSFLIKNELLKYEEGVTGKEEIKYPEKNLLWKQARALTS